ncbi:Arginyl-tRNA synthetase, cytoplasmic [Termitomyces sp. T112]|nr:Arginyl-tRNA synthetase, cytoplasmic [Termitomyces sp. T112]
MALSVSGFPERLRQLDTDDSSLGARLNLFAKKRQNDTAPPDPSPVMEDEFAQMTILQPPSIDINPPLLQRPLQVNLTRAPQRRPSIGRLEIGSVSNRPGLPRPPPSVETQPPQMAHPRPLPAVPAAASQGPIIESSKSAALRAAALDTVQPLPRPPASRNAIAGPSRPRAATTGAQHTEVHQQPLTVGLKDIPDASLLSSTPTPAPTPALSPTPTPAGALVSCRPLPRIPPVSAAPIASTAPIPAAPLSAAAVISLGQSPYVPRPSRVRRPTTSPSSSAGFGATVGLPFDASGSWTSRPVDLDPSGSGSTSNAGASGSRLSAHGSGSNAHASSSGSNVHASGSGPNAHPSGSRSSSSAPGSVPTSASRSNSRPRSLPRPRSHSRSRNRDPSAEASGSRSRGAASPIRRAPLATGSTSVPLPSSPGFASASAAGSGSGAFTTPPSSRRGSAASNRSTPRSSMNAGAMGSPKTSPRIPSLPPQVISRTLPPTAKIIKESAITSVRAMTFTASVPSSPALSTFPNYSVHTSIPPSPSAHATVRSQSISHPTSILKGSKNHESHRTRALQLHSPPPKVLSSPSQKSRPFETADTTAGADADASVDADDIFLTGDRNSLVSRSPSPIRYAPHEDLLCSDDDAHPDQRSRPRNRAQLRSYRHSYRTKQSERSPSPIAYAKRSSADMGQDVNVFDNNNDDDDNLEFGDGMQKQKKHMQPRSYQFTKPAGQAEEEKKAKEKDSVWKELLSKKDSKDSKDLEEGRENKEGGLAAWKINFGSGLVRKRSKSKTTSKTSSRDSISGPTIGTNRASVIDISNPPLTSNTAPSAFASNYSNLSLISKESEECTVNSHESSSRASTGAGSKESKRRRQRSLASPSTPLVLLPTVNRGIDFDVPVRNRTISDVSQQRRSHMRVKSDFDSRRHGHGYGQTHKLSGCLAGSFAWGAEVDTGTRHALWDETRRLVPVRRDMGSTFDSEEEGEEGKRVQGFDVDMMKIIPALKRLKSRQ